jgi:hypothetical protein
MLATLADPSNTSHTDSAMALYTPEPMVALLSAGRDPPSARALVNFGQVSPPLC